MKTVFVVTEGEYSDYHIEGIYSTPEIAKGIHGENCDVEEWEIDRWSEEYRQGLYFFDVYMTRDGETNHRGTSSVFRNPPPSGSNVIIPYYKANTTEFCFRMWARDERHAIKIANERRVQLIAGGTWK
jgi:hypothetical protein